MIYDQLISLTQAKKLEQIMKPESMAEFIDRQAQELKEMADNGATKQELVEKVMGVLG